MSSPGIQSGCGIFPQMQLEDVFLHFLPRFEALPVPRSIAEIRITPEERDALIVWITGQQGYPALWCESLWQVSLDGTRSASNQEMYGGILLILASELCREKATEDAVWPTVTTILRADRGSYRALFVAGQPTTLCKEAIEAGVRRLQLRNVIDRYGAQEYFDTLKLQFGFTYGGALRRLPEWLDNLGFPIAVRLLLGQEAEYKDLASASFKKLWFTLQDYRRGRVSRDVAAHVVDGSAWIQINWASQLLDVARERLTRRPSELEVPNSSQSDEPMFRPELSWEANERPRLTLRINEERIVELAGSAQSLVFSVDGKVTGRWLLQEDGQWRGSRTIPCVPMGGSPNLRPRVVTVGGDGAVFAEIDLTEEVPQEPFSIFDLTNGNRVDMDEPLSPMRDYAFVCDADLAVPAASSKISFKGYTAHRVRAPWEDVQVMAGDAVCWRASTPDRAPLQPIRVSLQTAGPESHRLGSSALLHLRGIPPGTTPLVLRIGERPFSLCADGTSWRTQNEVPLSLDLAMGVANRRLRVEGPDYLRTIVPRLDIPLRGVAFLEQEGELRWSLVKPDRPLNRADGSGHAKVFFESSEAKIFEGSRFVGKARARTLPLRDLFGWGAPLQVDSQDAKLHVLVPSVEDRGIGTFLPPLFRGQSDARLFWRTPVELSGEHRVYAWASLAERPVVLDHNVIKSEDQGYEWRLPNLGSIAAMAVTFRGTRLSAWWSLDQVKDSFRHKPSLALFALARWLKVPLLNPSLKEIVQQAVAQAPADLVEGWYQDSGLHADLIHRDGDTENRRSFVSSCGMLRLMT